MERLNRRKRRSKKSLFGSGGIRTHASEETGALNQRLRPLGHATCLSSHALSVFLKSFYSCALITINNNTTFFFFSSYQRWWPRNVVSIRSSQPVSLSKTTKLIIAWFTSTRGTTWHQLGFEFAQLRVSVNNLGFYSGLKIAFLYYQWV